MAAKPSPLHLRFIRTDTRLRRLSGLAQIVGGLLLLGLLALSSIGCGPGYPPENRIIAPQIAVDSQGNVITLYQVNDSRGPITYVQKLSPDGERLWGEKGVRLDEREPDFPGSREVTTSSCSHPLVVDQDDDVMVFWTYQGQIYAEKLDSNGKPLWQPERLVVGTCHGPGQEVSIRWAVAVNGANVTIAWTDENGDLGLQSMNGDGDFLWTGRPLDVSAYEMEALRDQGGNTWLMRTDASTRGVHLQVTDEAGRSVWTEARELQGAQPGRLATYELWLAEDGLGGVVAAWRYGDDAPVEVRSISLAGEVQVNAADSYFKQNEGATLPEPLMDRTDGLVALWTAGDSVLAQCIDSEGRMAWGGNGILVGTNLATPDTGSPHYQGSDQPGGTIVSWEAETAEGTVWRAQRIDSQGNVLWTGDGVTISTVTKGGWQWQWLATTSDGAALLSGVATENANRGSRLQKVSADGKALWGQEGIRLDDWRDGK